MLRRFESRGVSAVLDTSEQRLAIDVGPDGAWDEPTLSPVPPPAWEPRFVSASVLAYKAKRADDAIYAAVERAAQPAKRAFLASLANAAPVPNVVAARVLAGDAAEPTDGAVRKALARFLADEKASKPIGFYSEADDLAAIFRHDRMLMQEVEDEEHTSAIARAIESDASLARAYAWQRTLASRMTNPPPGDLRSVLDPPRGAVKARILLPSRSPEGDLVLRLFGDGPIPDGFDLATEVIERVQAGTLSLAARADSGFYDHQLHALEALIAFERTEEARLIDASPSYREHLRDVFRALFALTRETHAKQLMPIAVGGPPPVVVTPELVAEPVVTFFRRRAESYRFLRGVLDEAFGTSWQDFAGARVAEMESLLDGAADAVLRDLGAPRSAEPDGHERVFRAWTEKLDRDSDLAADARMMVPVFYDVVRKQTKVWAVIGWSERSLVVSYARPPVVRESAGKVAFGKLHRDAAYPVAIELYVDRVLDRSEMRRLCDTHRTHRAIVDALRAASAGR